jgi:hypothetical protein
VSDDVMVIVIVELNVCEAVDVKELVPVEVIELVAVDDIELVAVDDMVVKPSRHFITWASFGNPAGLAHVCSSPSS